MLEFKRLNIQDKPLIDSFIRPNRIENSALNFTNFYLWSASSDMMYAVDHDVLYLTFGHGEQPRKFFQPIPKDTNANKAADELMRPIVEFYGAFKQNLSVLCVSEQFKAQVLEQSNQFEFFDDRDNYDYIYKTEDLINFSGKKYHSKRNFINRFLMEHEAVYERYTEAHFDECWQLYSQWYRGKDDSLSGMGGEPLATNAALSYYKELELVGGVIKVDGRIQAFTFGEMITEDMVLIHIEKANAEIAGLYPYTTQQFALIEWAETQWMNRMEDMGIQGLRKAKLSLQPNHMFVKSTMRLRA